MPRSKRVLHDGAVYHIVQRGHNKDRLFNDYKDYKVFKGLVRKYKSRFTFDIYHYCIMSNHIHILLKAITGSDLPKIMQGITQSYSFYYRLKYKYSGYVYQNRYKSYLIEDDSYLMDCGRYIERNPLRAGIVESVSQYRWSSYNFYAKGYPDGIITPDPIYEGFGATPEERRCNYREYVLEERSYEKVLDKALLEMAR